MNTPYYQDDPQRQEYRANWLNDFRYHYVKCPYKIPTRSIQFRKKDLDNSSSS